MAMKGNRAHLHIYLTHGSKGKIGFFLLIGVPFLMDGGTASLHLSEIHSVFKNGGLEHRWMNLGRIVQDGRGKSDTFCWAKTRRPGASTSGVIVQINVLVLLEK